MAGAVAQQVSPRLSGLAVPVSMGDELLAPVGADPIITSVHSLCCSSRMFTRIPPPCKYTSGSTSVTFGSGQACPWLRVARVMASRMAP